MSEHVSSHIGMWQGWATSLIPEDSCEVQPDLQLRKASRFRHVLHHAGRNVYYACGTQLDWQLQHLRVIGNVWGNSALEQSAMQELRQISKTRLFLGRADTELGAARIVAKHLKCSVVSLLKAQKGNKTSSSCRGVVLESGRGSYRVKVKGTFVARYKNEKEAVDHMARVSKASPKHLREQRRYAVLIRFKTLLSVMSCLLPADLEDFVTRYSTSVNLFRNEPDLVVISAMWKFGPARDALAQAWQAAASPNGGLTPLEPESQARLAHLHHVLVQAVNILNGVHMATWAANAGKGVAHHQGWLAWCQLRVPIIRVATRGTLVLGQQRCTQNLCKTASAGFTLWLMMLGASVWGNAFQAQVQGAALEQASVSEARWLHALGRCCAAVVTLCHCRRLFCNCPGASCKASGCAHTQTQMHTSNDTPEALMLQ